MAKKPLPALNTSVAEAWASLPPEERREMIASFPPEQLEQVLYDWKLWARPDQRLPEGEWLAWMLMSGRGAGKTRTGAETVREWIGGPKDPPIRVALVAQSAADARDVMVEGESGILAISPPWNRPIYRPSTRRLVWPNGSVATTYSGDKPDQLRGPQHHKAWVDELAKFQYPQDTWDNLEMGLRLGKSPQAVVTTTPRPIPLIRDLASDPLVKVSKVSTYANLANLAPSFIARVIKKYEGTRLGRQELLAEILSDTPGALWTYEMLEDSRIAKGDMPMMRRIVIAVDPAVSAEDESNETGIIVAGKGIDNKGYILADLSGVYTPDGWARKVLAAMNDYNASRVVAERNQGGKLVEAVMRTAAPNMPIRLVWAATAKGARAEPIAALYEQRRAKHVGMFAKLEDQMTLMTPDGYTGAGSPDHLDAAVWALTELMLGSQVVTDPSAYQTFQQ